MFSFLGTILDSIFGSILGKAIGYFTKRKEKTKIEEMGQQLLTQIKENIEEATKHELDKKEIELKIMSEKELDDEWDKTFHK